MTSPTPNPTQSALDTAGHVAPSRRDVLLTLRADLVAKNEAATSWGAAIGARNEVIKEIDSELAALDAAGEPADLATARPSLIERLGGIYEWMCEPDDVEEVSLDWLKDWINRRPLAEFAMASILIPAEESASRASERAVMEQAKETLQEADRALMHYEWYANSKSKWARSEHVGLSGRIAAALTAIEALENGEGK